MVNREGFLIMPPMRRQNKQFDPNQRLQQLKIAVQRIHVERAIERLRRFGILRFVRHGTYKHFNKVMYKSVNLLDV